MLFAHISYAIILKLLCKMPWIQNLDLYQCINVTDDTLRNAAICCPQIKYIDISECSQLTAGSIHYVSNCRSLESLNINLSLLAVDRFHIIQNLAKNNSSLIQLSMSACKIRNVGYDWYLICEEVETSNTYSSIS